jgi:PAS domain S-box-containing protein
MMAVNERSQSQSDGRMHVAPWLCAGGAAVGAVGLIGWRSGTHWLTTIVPGLPGMMPNTALALLLIGSAGAARQSDNIGPARLVVSIAATLVVLTMSVGTLAEYALAIELPILRVGQVLAHSQFAISPAQSSPFTALALTCLAAGLLLFNVRSTARVRPSELLILCAALIAFTALTGIILGAPPLFRLTRTPLIGLSLPTALGLLLTSMGLLVGPARAGVIPVATSSGPGGILIRRLTLPVMVVPIVLGLGVTRLALMQGIVEVSVPVAILAASMTAVSLFLLFAIALPLNRAHEDLQASRTRIAQLVEHAPDGIFVADIDGRYTDVNDAGCRLLGYSRDELIGKTIIDLLPASDVERLWQSRQLLLSGVAHVEEWTLRRKDGSYVPVEVSAKILSDHRWQGFVRDISERKRLSEELRLSEAKSSGILAISSDAIVSIDEEQHITQFNEGAEQIFGYSKAEALGAPLEMLIPERFRPAHRLHVTGFAASPDVARKMGTRHSVIVGLRKNGEEFAADAAISKLAVGGKRILTVVVRDFTEQKRIENEQRLFAEIGSVLASTLDSEEAASRVAEVAVQTFSDVCVIDLIDGAGELRRLSVVGRDSSRQSICNALRQVPLDWTCPPLVESVVESRRPLVIQHPTPADVERLAHHGNRLDAVSAIELQSLMVMPLLARGRFLGAISFLLATRYSVDARADLHIAQELADLAALAVENARLYREAQRATQARDEVLGIVAHDLRNPLSMILLEARLMAQPKPGFERRGKQPYQQIERAALRMNRLIQDLLDVTRMEAGRLTVERSRLPAAQIATDAADAHRAAASATSLELRLELAPELPKILADRDRLLQVFENLIGNAIRFTPSGGCITVGAAGHDAEVRFWVRDTGPGIAIEDQLHLFDRFWQARTNRGGAGLEHF